MMHLRKIIFKCYSIMISNEIKMRYLCLGFEGINKRIMSVDKRLLIPILRKHGATIGTNCDVESPLIINAKGNYGNLTVGDNCYIGKNVVLDIKGKISIKNNVVISMSSTILSHIDIGNSKVSGVYPPCPRETILGSHCYIGAASCILPGIRIGEGSIVGAGSVVNKDVAPRTGVAGVPAKEFRKIEM
jgi:acetyltransferase-like isoleucine patch superfamily enzyme